MRETLTASSSSSAVASSSVASSARGLRVGEVDTDPATVEVLVVEAVDGTVGLVLRGEGNKAEATRLSGLTVLRDEAAQKQAGKRERRRSGSRRQAERWMYGHDDALHGRRAFSETKPVQSQARPEFAAEGDETERSGIEAAIDPAGTGHSRANRSNPSDRVEAKGKKER